MLKIERVYRGCGKKLKLKKGDKIISIGGYAAADELDYLYYDSLEKFNLTVTGKKGERTVAVEKSADESLGLKIAHKQITTCRNKCLFCFIDQMPKGMRSSLYVKDDDVKYSFICGNFVTLTNLSDADIDRIIRLKLSPLYISVHATDGAVRQRLTGNRFAGDILKRLERLTLGGIGLHTQAVIVRGINDGEILKKTARDLFKLGESVKSLAIVPCGITKHREGLTQVQPYDRLASKEIIKSCAELNAEFGQVFVTPSDEFYFTAGEKLPSADYYGDFPQLENGVGMAAKFDLDFNNALRETSLKSQKNALIVTGAAAYEFIKSRAKLAQKYIKNLKTEVICCKNNFFGETVTCAGLLTGGDITECLKDTNLKHFDCLILPSNMLKEFERVFLDGMTVRGLSRRLKIKIRIAGEGGEDFFQTLASI